MSSSSVSFLSFANPKKATQILASQSSFHQFWQFPRTTNVPVSRFQRSFGPPPSRRTIGPPQQINCPPPTCLTSTTFPHTSQRQISPICSTTATGILLLPLPWRHTSLVRQRSLVLPACQLAAQAERRHGPSLRATEPPVCPKAAYGCRNFETKGDSPTSRRRKCPEGPCARNSANHASCSISSFRIASTRS